MARDDRLVRAARRGDDDAWRALYRRHSARIEALVGLLGRSDWSASAEDLVAEAWLTAASKIEEFEGSDDDFAGWLYTIARNHGQNRRRTAQRRRTDPTDQPTELLPVGGPVAGDPAAEVASEDVVRRLLAHLSPREVEVVTCMDVVGLDGPATARALGMRPTAVRVARHRALGRLRKVLAEDPQALGPGVGTKLSRTDQGTEPGRAAPQPGRPAPPTPEG